jgi:putative ABC transport system substrate-binding protein
MQRREFITLLGGSVAVTSVAARAQPPAMPVIGYLSSSTPVEWAERLQAFHQGLGEAGYIEGRNIAIEFAWSGDRLDRLPELAAQLVRRRVQVIAAFGGIGGSLAAKMAVAGTPIPVVFATGEDPVATGLVVSLNRPGGNITGVTTLGVEVAPKRLELMHEIVPAGSLVAVLINPDRPTAQAVRKDLETAAHTLGRSIRILHASNEREIEAAFATCAELQARALVIGSDAYFNSRVEQFAALTARYALPTIYQNREFAAAGGLMSYGSSITDAYRIVGGYTGRILKGEKPADLPVQQATRIELIINMKTAKALGLTFPLTLLGRADEVIE